MSNNYVQQIESLINTAKSKKAAKEWGLARADYLQAYELITLCDFSDQTIQQHFQQIQNEIQFVENELAENLFQKGKAAVENQIWQYGIITLEEATRLANENNITLLEEIKTWLDKAKLGESNDNIKSSITPFIERANNFKHSNNLGEAILELQSANKIVKNLPDNHPYKIDIQKQLTECCRTIARQYLKKAYKAMHVGHYNKAASLLKRALYLVDEKDVVYQNFITDILIKRIEPNTGIKEITENDEPESQKAWEKAVKDYEEALNLYTSYTITDPFAPAYTGNNIYEDRFVESRRQLGRLYKKRADNLKNLNKVDNAILNYKEAIKLLPKTDKYFHEAIIELNKLKVQVNIPEE